MTAEILTANPTDLPRTQVAIFGVKKGEVPDGASVLDDSLPDSTTCTAVVALDPFFDGKYAIDPDIQSNEIDDIGSLPMFLIEDGENYMFSIHEDLASNAQMRVYEMRARGKHGHAKLFVYQGAREPWCRYQMLYTLENKTAPDMGIKIGISTFGDYILKDRRAQDPKHAFDFVLRDAQGIHLSGVAIDAGSPLLKDPSVAVSAAANLAWDMTAMGIWPRWGIWKTEPRGEVSAGDRRPSFGLKDHLGVILNKRPGDTGDQIFKTWWHFDSLGKNKIGQAEIDRWAAYQSVCRPIWYLESNGDIPLPKDHPNYRSWSEKAHWHHGVSPDQMGRVFSHGGWYTGWLGQDEEHYCATAIAEVAILHGDYLCRRICEMKAFHLITQNRWPGIGRAVGRLTLGAVEVYRATGDKRVLDGIIKKGIPAFLADFEAVNGKHISPDRVYALRLYNGDPHTGIPGLEHIVWEDAISIMGLDAAIQYIPQDNLAAQLKIRTYLLGKTIIEHGFREDGQILKARQWLGQNKYGPKQVWADGTNYRSWAIPCLAITARLALEFGDQATADKAGEIKKTIDKTNRYARKDYYIAPIGTGGN